MPARNPNWTRDELILALDLYFKVSPVQTTEKNPGIVELSQILNELPIHSHGPGQENFRNPNSVYMKLCNFLRLDPDYPGVGLDAGSKLDEIVWNEYASDRARLAQTARAIRESYSTRSITVINIPGVTDEEFPEGRVLTRVHQLRERNAGAVRKKKDAVLRETGTLACEVCGFDFFAFYGEAGQGFIECHHTIPVSELTSGSKTKLSDLALVCSNCHRILHRSRPWLSISQLKEIIELNNARR